MTRRPARFLIQGLAAVTLLVPSALVFGDDSSPHTLPGTEWPTQDWPMTGQDNDQPRNITARFTTARLGITTTSPIAGPSHFGPFTQFAGKGEMATAAVGGSIQNVSPHGIGVLCTELDLTVLANVGAWNTNAGAVNFYVAGCPPMVGTPLLVPVTSPGEVSNASPGDLDIYVLSNGCSRLTKQRIRLSSRFVAGMGGGFTQAVMEDRGDEDHGIFDTSSHFVAGPVLDNNVIYFATDRKQKDNVQGPGYLFAVKKSDMQEKWKSPLQTGSGSQGPVPKGQEPPPPSERFHATTVVAVREDLAVVACRKYDDRDDGVAGHALFAYNTLDGVQRWIFRTDAAILPNPVITRDYVIFGTADGRAHVLNHNIVDRSRDGTVFWETPFAQRIRYKVRPFNEPQALEDEALYGPALSQNGQYAYFAGSGCRVHRFDIASGASASSETLAYFGSITYRAPLYLEETDSNGAPLIRPCLINSPPVVYKNQALLVKCWTQNMGVVFPPPPQAPEYGLNGAFLFALRLPDLSFNSQISQSPSVRFDPDAVQFVGGGTFGGVALNTFHPYSSFGFTRYNEILRATYLFDVGLSYVLSPRGTPGGTFDDSGGVSIGSGFVMATDRGGQIICIPSTDSFTPKGGSGALGPFTPPLPGPRPDLEPAALGPIEIFPNPYNPAAASGGVAKFRNLPTGSVVELYTLAHERVRMLTPAGHLAVWNGKNESGQDVAMGVYLYRIVLPDDKPPIIGRLALVR